jgi:hypothetical protein
VAIQPNATTQHQRHSYATSKTVFAPHCGTEERGKLGSFCVRFGQETTLPTLFSSIYTPFFSSFLQNEPNSHFSQRIHFKTLPHFSVGFVW